MALLARYPEQADLYYEGLKRAEVPYLRRVRAQEFAFRPGVEVTEIRQVKGLEFDYVVLRRRQRVDVPGRRRVAPPLPHRGDARGAPAVAGGDLVHPEPAHPTGPLAAGLRPQRPPGVSRGPPPDASLGIGFCSFSR